MKINFKILKTNKKNLNNKNHMSNKKNFRINIKLEVKNKLIHQKTQKKKKFKINKILSVFWDWNKFIQIKQKYRSKIYRVIYIMKINSTSKE